jgi:hypothetical protein
MQSAKRLFLATSLGLTESLVNAKPAPAQMPQQWQLNLQHPATPVMERLYDFHTFLLWIISAIALFVFGLLFLAMVRFREKINPVPSRTTHHTLLEVVWTVAPVLILVMIARALNHLTVPMGIDSPGLMKNPAAEPGTADRFTRDGIVWSASGQCPKTQPQRQNGRKADRQTIVLPTLFRNHDLRRAADQLAKAIGTSLSCWSTSPATSNQCWSDL